DVPARDGYRVVSWRDRCPDEWAEAYCRLQNSFVAEAPTGDLDLEATTLTVERLREVEEEMAARGKRAFVSVGVSPDGELVGYTELGVPADDPDTYQGETLVDPAHRGHGLGLALKAANL